MEQIENNLTPVLAQQLTPISQLLKESWNIFPANIRKFIYVGIVGIAPFILLGLSFFISIFLKLKSTDSSGILIYTLILVLATIMGVICQQIYLAFSIFGAKERSKIIEFPQSLEFIPSSLIPYIWKDKLLNLAKVE